MSCYDLFREAMLCDLAPSEFWRMTLKELLIFINAKKENRRDSSEELFTAAYTTAVLGRTKKIPPLSKFITPKQQKPEDSFNKLRALNKAIGGKEI